MSLKPDLTIATEIEPTVTYKELDFKLPSLDIAPVNWDNLIDKEGKVKEPHWADKIVMEANNKSVKDILDTPRGYMTYDQAIRYNDPLIPYDPSKDMEATYMSANPFSYGDSISKMWELTKESVSGNLKSAFFGGMEAISTEDSSKLWDNEHSEEIVDVYKRVEELMPQYMSQDVQENPFSSISNLNEHLKSFIPSGASVITGIVEAGIVQAGMTATGIVLGGAVGGAGGFLAGLGKNVFTAGKTINNVYKVAKAVANTQRASKILNFGRNAMTKSQMLISSGLAAAGEAGMLANMNRDKFLSSELNAFENEYGRLPNDKEAKEIAERANDLAQTTYNTNFLALTLSNNLQLGNILKGAGVSLHNPLRNISNKGLSYTKKSTKGARLRELGESAFSEGMEEYFQTTVDLSTSSYYSAFNKDYESYTEALLDKVVTTIGTTEGQLSFLGGAVIGGGVTGLSQGVGAYNYKRKSDKILNKLNSSSKSLIDNLAKSHNNEKDFLTNLKDNKFDKALSIISDDVFNYTKAHRENGMDEKIYEVYEDLKGMDLKEFNKVWGVTFNEEQKANTLSFLEDTTAMSLNALKTTDKELRFNPFMESNWFTKIAEKEDTNSLSLYSKNLNKTNSQKAQLWGKVKDLYSNNIFKASRTQNNVNKIREEFEELPQAIHLIDIINNFNSPGTGKTFSEVSEYFLQTTGQKNKIKGLESLVDYISKNYKVDKDKLWEFTEKYRGITQEYKEMERIIQYDFTENGIKQRVKEVGYQEEVRKRETVKVPETIVKEETKPVVIPLTDNDVVKDKVEIVNNVPNVPNVPKKEETKQDVVDSSFPTDKDAPPTKDVNTDNNIITESDYKDFINTGKVSSVILESIAKKVMNKNKLNEKENSIFISKTKEINELILKISSKKTKLEVSDQGELLQDGDIFASKLKKNKPIIPTETQEEKEINKQMSEENKETTDVISKEELQEAMVEGEAMSENDLFNSIKDKAC